MGDKQMQKKYFFFDIDGTLIPGTGNKNVPEDTQEALAQLQNNGHFVAIATGRAHCLAVQSMINLGFSNMVSDGGYAVTLNGKLQGIEPLDRNLCIELAEECDMHGYAWGCGIEDDPVRLTKSQKFCDETNDSYQIARIVPELDLHNEPIILRMFIALPAGEESKHPALQKLPWIRYSGMNYIYVEPADKAKGIRKIMQIYGARNEDVVVFGDELNDLSMFMPEWTCIAMGNGREELKRKASFVTKDADKGGIQYALKHFGWI
jgi:Cof subfamily protein (haloacid dehalogenase superfamily)